ncbi:MAG: S-adenosylmethionine:tRNA ribosyltransferase-isomerase, partial [Hyphomicrobiaceae bacterium]|nr:S-adenosylmethionine:tRNA ribosyltransferase-isomerase [Hyphomicrobiaceae bacterium]
MRVDAFDFDLPEERIALHAVEPRDAARLLVAAPEGALRDRAVRDLADELRSGDLLVFNDTRVLPVQLESLREREGTPPLAISATLVRRDEPDRWSAFVKPGRRVKTGDVLRFGDKDALFAEVLGKEDGGLVALRFDRSGSALDAAIAAIGAPPLPPYIAQRRAFEENDRSRYQTVYAARDGSVAAPTAGLHFTPELLQRLEAKGIARATVTLHVGLGTFLPVKVEDTDDHVMHAEWGEVSAQT